MAIQVTMPQLGESVSEGTVSKWLVHEGDVVTKDQPLVEIATDKADSELPAPAGGRVGKLLAAEGDVVSVGAALCELDETGAGAATSPAAAAAPAAAPPAAAAAAPSRSATGANLATPAARKAALEHSVDLAGVSGSGEHGRIGPDDVLRARNGGSGGESPAIASAEAAARAAEPSAAGPKAQADSAKAGAAAPAAGAAAKAQGARANDLASIINGAGGFVPPIPGLGYGSFKVPPYRPKEGDKVVPFSRRRRITADHMTYSKFSSPHVVTVAEVDLFNASRLRDAHKDRYKKEGHALTMLAFVAVAAAKALRENLSLNARVLDDSYVVFGDVNLGVAVDSPDGLVVPVIRRADELGVRGITRGIDELAKRARTGKITLDDLSGATFSITNPGLKGNLFGGAIINQPNVGILRMGEIAKRVVVVESATGEDAMAIHPVMYMALSYDHRIVDGVAANSFLWRVTEILEKAEFEV
jgi:2-oxoglutarate dehydrogenase E2 component (dihydrolipoamide succinyltransferase)